MVRNKATITEEMDQSETSFYSHMVGCIHKTLGIELYLDWPI